MDTIAQIRTEIENSISVKQSVLHNPELLKAIGLAGDHMIRVLKSGGKILVCGNGGSASDALHIAGELLGRFQRERRGYAAIALNSDVATMTAIANDYGYERVFARQVEGLMTDRDVLLGITTSGNSPSVLYALEEARRVGGETILLSGRDGGHCKKAADISVIVPSDITARIQETHECIYHIWCGLIEEELR